MYVAPNFKTKKALKEAVKAGWPVLVYSPSPFSCEEDGIMNIEGPHSPKPHTWYAQVKVENSKIIKVIA